MAKAASRAKDSPPFPGTFQSGQYGYRVSSGPLGSKLTVDAAGASQAADLTWTFGAGVHGQTYILEKNGSTYESEISRFAELHGLDISPGHNPPEEGNLQGALGERLSAKAAARCFACHTTASSAGSIFNPSQAKPGIHCEACHGPGAEHAEAMLIQRPDEGTIFNPTHISPAESVDFCGACHRTSLDVIAEKSYGTINIRFQPYRLEKSRCWGTQGDNRLICSACHDPHAPLVKDAAYYDKRCLSCHTPAPIGAAKPAHAVCPQATENCTSCHMPRYDVPGMHAKFTDHFIRIVRAGASFPN